MKLYFGGQLIAGIWLRKTQISKSSERNPWQFSSALTIANKTKGINNSGARGGRRDKSVFS